MNVFLRSAHWTKHPPPLSITRGLPCKVTYRPCLNVSQFRRFSNISLSKHSARASRQLRYYQNLAQSSSSSSSSNTGGAKKPPTPAVLNQVPTATQDLGGEAVHITVSEQRRKDRDIVGRLMRNIWPKNDWNTRGRVILGFGLLVAGKVWRIYRHRDNFSCLSDIVYVEVLNVQVPLVFKDIIDSLNLDIASGSTVWVVAGSLVLGCEYARFKQHIHGCALLLTFILCRWRSSHWSDAFWRAT